MLRRPIVTPEFPDSPVVPCLLIQGPFAHAGAASGDIEFKFCGKRNRVGHYRLLREIGRGGMGVVYEAEQEHPRRPVALKVIRGGRLVDEYQVKLFRREAQALARLKHPGIAAIYEAGVLTMAGITSLWSWCAGFPCSIM